MDETTVRIQLQHLSECDCHPGWFVLMEWDGDELEAAWRALALKGMKDPTGAYKLAVTTTRTTVRMMCLGGERNRDRLSTGEG